MIDVMTGDVVVEVRRGVVVAVYGDARNARMFVVDHDDECAQVSLPPLSNLAAAPCVRCHRKGRKGPHSLTCDRCNDNEDAWNEDACDEDVTV